MPKDKPIKIIIDTNLWISFVISKKFNLFDNLLFSGRARLLFSKELIDEIQQTILKPKLKKYFGNRALEIMLLAFEPFIDLIETKSNISTCRDPKDNFLLALAKDGGADYLITGDNDLLDLVKFEKTNIIKIVDSFQLKNM
jgi:hypothetical protein